jgi:hypothetical protein
MVQLVAMTVYGCGAVGNRQQRSGYRDDTELLNRSANHADLETIATRTTGSFQLHGGLRNILWKMREEHLTKVTRTVKFPDWDEPSDALQGLLFAVFVACLSLEWVLRRLWGLV